MIRVAELTQENIPAAAALAADAFSEDPYWLALAPLPARWRHALIRDMTHAELVHARTDQRCLGAFEGGRLLGLARVAQEREHRVARWPPRAILGTGPLGVRRWRRAEGRLTALLPHLPHDYLYTIAVAPQSQRSGLGRRLLEPVIARSARRGMPLWLDTMSPVNLPFYEHFGFRVSGEYSLARGYRAWVMRRDPAEVTGQAEVQ